MLKIFVCLLFVLNVFYIFLINLYLFLCQKSKNTQKVEKAKSLIGIIVFCHKHVLSCTSVLMALCIYKHSLFFMHSYHCGKNIDIYVTVVNRSSNLS